MMRIILFLCTNLSVMFLFGCVISVLGLWNASYSANLIVMAGVFGLGGSLVSLFLSKFIALSAVRGRIVHYASSELEDWLLKVIHYQSSVLGIRPPQLAVYSAADMNAFATGVRKNSALIAVSTGLLENMSKKSIEAVVAHELNHVVRGDMITMALIQGIVNTFVIFISRILAQTIAYGVSVVDHYNNDEHNYSSDVYNHSSVENSLMYVIISSILELLFGFVANIIVLWFSRNREFYADAGAAKLVGCDKMILALQELEQNDCISTLLSSDIKTLYIYSETKKSILTLNNIISNLFSSHPPISKRIEALQSGKYLNKLFIF